MHLPAHTTWNQIHTPAASLEVRVEGQRLSGALALSAKEVWWAFAHTALVRSYVVATGRSLLVTFVARPLTVALADHLQVNNH